MKKVFFVGAGPGDPGLLTMRAHELLSTSDVVVFDANVSAAILELCPSHAKKIAASGNVAEELVRGAGGNRVVVRLCEGDVEFRSPAANEMRSVFDSGVALEIVPGIANATADGARPVDAVRLFERQPLFGRRVLITRTLDQAGQTAALLRERGAEPVAIPSIEIHPPSDPEPFRAAIARLKTDYDWVAFTSANGVEWTWREIDRAKMDARIFGPTRIAAIGPATARALALHGLVADVVAKKHRGEGLAADVLAAIFASAPALPSPSPLPQAGEEARARPVRVLLPRAREARDAFPEALRAAGCLVDIALAYETYGVTGEKASQLARALEGKRVDAVLFTSSSTVQTLAKILGEKAANLLSHVCVGSIGPVTTTTAKELAIRVDVTAERFTIPGLVDAIEAYFARSGKAARERMP